MEKKRFIICKASAGAGKTYTLVRHYIATAISSPSHLQERFESILAITFTNKAANEMKERIMNTLHGIVVGVHSYDNMLADLSKELNIDTEEVRRRCDVLQSAILHDYSNFAVSTIDSFVYRLVRTFAYELHLPLNFNVLIDDQEMLQSCVDELMTMVGSRTVSAEEPTKDKNTEELTRMLCAYVESRMDDGKSFHIENSLLKLAKEVLKEETPIFLNQLESITPTGFIELYRQYTEENRRFEQTLTQKGREVVEACKAAGLTAEDFVYKEAGFYGYFLHFADGDMQGVNKTSARAESVAATGVAYVRNAPPDVKDRVMSVTPTMVAAYESMQQLIKRERKEYNSRNMVLANLYGMALLNTLRQIKERYYSGNESVHISEFNKRIAEQIMGEPAPFIYERVGNRYMSYLIDEFQDTSRLQFKNFIPLIVEALSRTAGGGLSSLIVGDGKQAIYRFRQGDVRQFINLPQVEDPNDSHILAENTVVIERNQNYRTLANIVEFNNRFFEWVVCTRFAKQNENDPNTADNPWLQRLYIGDSNRPKAALVQEPQHEGGHVRLRFCPREELCQNILSSVRRQVDELHYSYGDIMILARDNATLTEISNFLVANIDDPRFRLLTSESFLLSNSQVVLFVQAVLRSLQNPDDRVAAVSVVRIYTNIVSPSSDGSCFHRLRQCHFDLQSFFDQENQRAASGESTCFQSIQYNAAHLRSLSLYDCCEAIVRGFHLEGRDTTYVASLYNYVLSFMQHHHSDLQAFNTWLEAKIDKLSSSTADDPNALRLMTIHKAKGLEGNIVMVAMPAPSTHMTQMWVDMKPYASNDKALHLPVAYVNMQQNESFFSPVFDAERQMSDMDRVNLLYVALTRPRQKLCVFCEQSNASGNGSIALLRDFAVTEGSQLVSEEEGCYTIGEDFVNPSQRKETEQPPAPDIEDIVFPSWEKRVAIAEQSQSVLSPLEDDSRRWGIVIHDLLAHMTTYEDVDPVVDDYCASHDFDETVGALLKTRIHKMMSSEENRKYFAPGNKVLCEASLVVDGSVRRPDRIVFNPDKTWIVDFKTGGYSPQKHTDYLRQVDEYVKAVSRMGYPNVKGSILYL